MGKQIILLILMLSFNNLNAQSDEAIINEILFDLFGFQQDTIFLKNLRTKTYFDHDSASFEKETGLAVPSKIISEWMRNVENDDFISVWNEPALNKIDSLPIKKDTVVCKRPVIKCITKDGMDNSSGHQKKRQRIFSISKILFDGSKENAVFNFTEIPRPGAFFSESILIKKVFGKWKIIERFHFIMT